MNELKTLKKKKRFANVQLKNCLARFNIRRLWNVPAGSIIVGHSLGKKYPAGTEQLPVRTKCYRNTK